MLYLPNEKLPISVGDRRAIFDIYCTNEKGEQFIVEMKKAEQKFLKTGQIIIIPFQYWNKQEIKTDFWILN